MRLHEQAKDWNEAVRGGEAMAIDMTPFTIKS